MSPRTLMAVRMAYFIIYQYKLRTRATLSDSPRFGVLIDTKKAWLLRVLHLCLLVGLNIKKKDDVF